LYCCNYHCHCCCNAGHRERRKTLGGKLEEQKEYTAMFAAPDPVDIKKEVIALLSLLQEVRQLALLRSVVHSALGEGEGGLTALVGNHSEGGTAVAVDAYLDTEASEQRVAAAVSQLGSALQVWMIRSIVSITITGAVLLSSELHAVR
jgi:pyruvate-formate lyase-activating enzyme